MFTNRFVEISFFSFSFLSQTSIDFQKRGYQLKDRLFPSVPEYSARVLFYLTPLSSHSKKCEGIFDSYFKTIYPRVKGTTNEL